MSKSNVYPFAKRVAHAVGEQFVLGSTTPVPILPDSRRINAAHAYDIAEAIVQAVRMIGGPLCLYLTAAGEMAVDTLGECQKIECAQQYLTLVGCYNEMAEVRQVRDDILASQRESLS